MTSIVHFDSELDAFARGGNRLCFVDPRDSNNCIKVARPDRAPAIKKNEKSFPASLKPLSAFDDNAEEFRVYTHIKRQIGDAAFELIPRCTGFVETNFGRGLGSEIIKDDDGKISLTLKQYLWLFGETDDLKEALTVFKQRWQLLGMPSRNLLLHNIVVQQAKGKIQRLVVIDGLGWPDVLPIAYYCRAVAQRKAKRKAARLADAIAALLAKKQQGGDWGYHGWMDDNKRKTGS
ncbi:MAG: YrbL family protein [Spongiibacteraceae bacterium]